MDKGLEHCKTSSEQDNTTQKIRGHPSMPCMGFKPTIPVRHHIPNAMWPLWSTKQNTKFLHSLMPSYCFLTADWRIWRNGDIIWSSYIFLIMADEPKRLLVFKYCVIPEHFITLILNHGSKCTFLLPLCWHEDQCMQFMQESVHTYYAICLCMWMMLGRNCLWKNAMRKHQKPSHENSIRHCAHISVGLKLSKILQWLCHRLHFGNYPVPVFAVQLTTHTEDFHNIHLPGECWDATHKHVITFWYTIYDLSKFLPLNMSHSKSHTTAHTRPKLQNVCKSKQQQQRIVWIKIIHTAQTDLYGETSNTDLVLLTWKTEK